MLEKFSSTPDYGVGKNYLNDEVSQTRDLRSPGYLKLAEKEFSYRLKIIILLVLDTFALWLGWSISFTPSFSQFNLSSFGQGSEITSLFSAVLAAMLCLFYAFELYRKGDKSRNIFSSIKAVFLSHVLILPIIFQFYPHNAFYQLGVAAFIATLLIVNLF